MNEFQAILTIIVYFAVRFVVPALIVYGLVRLACRLQGPDPDTLEQSEPSAVHL